MKHHIFICVIKILSRQSRVTETAQEIVDSIPYFFANNRPMFAICQDYYRLCGEERRRKERMMSRCFNWFPFWWFRRTQVIPEFRGFYKNWGILLKEVVNMNFIVEEPTNKPSTLTDCFTSP